jgi:hypothetical protein
VLSLAPLRKPSLTTGTASSLDLAQAQLPIDDDWMAEIGRSS